MAAKGREGVESWRERLGRRGETDVFIDRNAEATSKGEIGNLGKVRERAPRVVATAV